MLHFKSASRFAQLALIAASLLSLAAFCLAGEAASLGSGEAEVTSTLGKVPIRKLLFSVEVPIAQGRCAGTFTREFIPCYLSEYSLFASFA